MPAFKPGDQVVSRFGPTDGELGVVISMPPSGRTYIVEWTTDRHPTLSGAEHPGAPPGRVRQAYYHDLLRLADDIDIDRFLSRHRITRSA